MFKLGSRARDRWKEQIRKDAHVIEERDFSFLDRYVKDKRIVLLGESSHGISQYFTHKIDLIQYLHLHHGFNVLVLESGLLEAVLCKTFLHNDSPEERIQKCLLDIYHTEEMRPLFDQSEDWVQFLAVCGMDPQPTYPCISEQMLKWLKQHIDNDLYERIQTAESLYFELDKEIMFKVTKALKQRINVMITEYESILNEMDKMCQTFTEPEIHNMFQVIKRGLLNRLQWLKVNLKGYFSSSTARSSYMFENLEWLMNHYFKNEKIIVWAHNFHIRRRQTLLTKLFGIKTLGQWLHQKYASDIYSVGLYAGSGTYVTQLRVEKELVVTKKNHLESLLLESLQESSFLPLHTHKQTIEKQAWYNRKWMLLESGFMGVNPKVINPQEHYDALLFIREVAPPQYLQRSKENLSS